MKFKIQAIKGTSTKDIVKDNNEISMKSNLRLKLLNINIVIGAKNKTNKTKHNNPPGNKLNRFM
jgi:hypothetical protein